MSKRMALHLTYMPTEEIRQRLDRWDTAARHGVDLATQNWRMFVVWDAARDASVSGSTGIEGNPLTPAQVNTVLSGGAVDEDDVHVREVVNYNRAIELGRAAVSRPDFEWTHEIVHQVNAAVMDGLPRDTRGSYRGPGDEVFVGIYTGPSPLLVQGFMTELIDWLRASATTSSLVRSALLHLNVIAIHPFNDGNGRTARVLAAMALMEHGIPATELISIEGFIRRHRDEYVAVLRTTLGTGYDPENHATTAWLDYYTRVSLDRLDVRDRILEALPGDMGVAYAALADAGDPVEWAVILLAARVSRMRTDRVAAMAALSAPAARALLRRIVDAGWMTPQGRTRGRWYAPSARLEALPLRVPTLMRHLAAGDQLSLFEE
ncbi:MAG: Fic family protein [Chloroflexota bacterium]